HLGASTTEAQAMVAEDVAEQIVAVFKGQPARYAVNAPLISIDTMSVLMPFIRAATTAGRLVAQLVQGQMSSIRIKYEGDIASYDTNALRAAVLGGLLEEVSEERVNLVNANIVAARRGLTVIEQTDAACENYASLITAEVTTSTDTINVATTLFRGEIHIVRVNDYWVDISPSEGLFLFIDHLDRPGLLGSVGGITGDANVDISSMHVGRLKPRGQALMILALDEPISEERQEQILAVPDIYSVKVVKL
ncbi:MAG: phosphoglycerate dehydrogenase, partial [Dehalococcoidales bacterium]